MKASRILVVDDEPVIRNFLLRVLEKEGYHVATATDGNEALYQLANQAFDLLLTDIKMDGMDGVQLLQECRQLYPDLSIILLTGHATVSSAILALREGAFDYLLKPVKNEEIVSAIALALQKRVHEKRRDRLEVIAQELAGEMQNEDGPSDIYTDRIELEDFYLDTASHTVVIRDQPMDLTPTEFRLLRVFAQKRGVVIHYVDLAETACGYSCTIQEAREIMGTHIRNLRRKMDAIEANPFHIESVRAIGYKFIRA